jgi:hypothetical protein
MKKQVLIVVAALSMVFMATSCQKAPQEQIDAAKASVESVKATQAELYVPAEYAALQDSMTTIMAAIEVQNSKTFKNYDAIKLQLDAVMIAANQVSANAVAAKEQVKAETEQYIAATNLILEENRSLMTVAPKGKEGAAVLAEIEKEMVMIEDALAEVAQLLATGDYLTAQTKAMAAKENASAITTELNEAIAKVKKR